jgi:hypothetical protein
MAKKSRSLIPAERIERAILFVRGEKVMLDTDLAALYGVPTKRLLQAVKRNLARFPDDFMFQLSLDEAAAMRSQFVTASKRNLRYRPYAFTEQGVAMLSSVLRSPRAVEVNVEIMRAFVRMRRMLASNAELARKIDELESKYDQQFAVVFEAIRQLMEPPPAREPREMGFHTIHRPPVGEPRGIRQRKVALV